MFTMFLSVNMHIHIHTQNSFFRGKSMNVIFQNKDMMAYKCTGFNNKKVSVNKKFRSLSQ